MPLVIQETEIELGLPEPPTVEMTFERPTHLQYQKPA